MPFQEISSWNEGFRMSKQRASSTRRQFLADSSVALSAAAAVTADASAAPSEQPPIRCIDCQSHLFCPEIVAMMERRSEDPLVYRKDGDRYVKMGDWHRKILPNHMDV